MAERLWGESADVLMDAGLDPDALAALERQLRTDLGPCDVEVHDVHVHLGRDADGHRLDPADLEQVDDGRRVELDGLLGAMHQALRDLSDLITSAQLSLPGDMQPLWGPDQRRVMP